MAISLRAERGPGQFLVVLGVLLLGCATLAGCQERENGIYPCSPPHESCCSDSSECGEVFGRKRFCQIPEKDSFRRSGECKDCPTDHTCQRTSTLEDDWSSCALKACRHSCEESLRPTDCYAKPIPNGPEGQSAQEQRNDRYTLTWALFGAFFGLTLIVLVTLKCINQKAKLLMSVPWGGVPDEKAHYGGKPLFQVTTGTDVAVPIWQLSYPDSYTRTNFIRAYLSQCCYLLAILLVWLVVQEAGAVPRYDEDVQDDLVLTLLDLLPLWLMVLPVLLCVRFAVTMKRTIWVRGLEPGSAELSPGEREEIVASLQGRWNYSDSFQQALVEFSGETTTWMQELTEYSEYTGSRSRGLSSVETFLFKLVPFRGPSGTIYLDNIGTKLIRNGQNSRIEIALLSPKGGGGFEPRYTLSRDRQSSAPAASLPSLPEELKQLTELHAAGGLTRDEFDRAKAAVIAKHSPGGGADAGPLGVPFAAPSPQEPAVVTTRAESSLVP